MPHNQYLQKRGQTWYVRVIVPPGLRKTVGKQHILRSLKTRDVVEAREKRWEALAQIKRHFHDLRGATGWDPVQLGLEYRGRYLAADGEPENLNEEPSNANLSQRDGVHYEITDDVDRLRDVNRSDDAKLLYRIATTNDAVLSEGMERWLKELEGKHNAQTIQQHRLAFRLLKEAYPDVVLAGDIDRRRAGRFISEFLVDLKGYSNKTAVRILSSLSSCWRWLIKRGWVASGENPWVGQGDYSFKRSKRPGGAKRPYSSEELVKLLAADPRENSAGGYSIAVSDLLRLGLMTGCRLNEMCSLEIRDVVEVDHAIRIKEGKTTNAKRTVPIHDAVWSIVERRRNAAAEAGPQAPLFPELKPGGPDGKRSWYLVKVFHRFREKVLGEDSTVDFHSLRRTCATYLEHAMAKTVAVNPSVIAELMGHEKGSLALSVYSGGLRIKHLRDAIDAMGEVMEPEVLQLVQGGTTATSARPIGEVSASTA